MHILKTIMTHIRLSSTNIQWYKHLDSTPLKQHILAWLTALFLGATIFTIRVYAVEIPRVSKNTITVVDLTAASFPADLELSWANETLLVNRDTLQVPLPDLLSASDPSQTQWNGVYLAKELSNEDAQSLLKDYTLVVDMKKIFIMDNNQVTAVSLSDLITPSTLTINAQTLPGYVDFIKSNIPTYTSVVYIVIPLLILMVLLPLRALSFIIDSVMLYFLLRILRTPISYKKIALICLNIMIPSEIMYQLSNLYGYDISVSIYALTFWLYAVIVLTYVQLTKTKDTFSKELPTEV